MRFRRGWLTAVVLLLTLTAAAAPSRADPEEQTVLAQLFSLNRTLEETHAQIARLDEQVKAVAADQDRLQAEHDRLEARRQERLAHFGQRLRFYSEDGAVAPFAYLLTSQSFVEFLERLDLLRQVLQTDSDLLAEIRRLKTDVARQEAELAGKRAEMAALRKQQEERAASLKSDIAEKERILASLQEKRAAVEAQLAAMDSFWEKTAKPVLDDLGTSLQTVDLTGFQPDSIKATLLPPGATIRISESNLNGFLTTKADLKGMAVKILPDRISLEGVFGGTAIRVSGNFAVQSRSVMRFEPKEIAVGDYKVPDQVTAEIMTQGKLDIDAASLLRGFALQQIRLESPYIVIKAGLR